MSSQASTPLSGTTPLHARKPPRQRAARARNDSPRKNRKRADLITVAAALEDVATPRLLCRFPRAPASPSNETEVARREPQGDTVSGHGRLCRVAVASEVFAHRWTPLNLRKLLAGSAHCNEINRTLPLIPKSTLAQRLRALEASGVLTCARARRPEGVCADMAGGHAVVRGASAGAGLAS